MNFKEDFKYKILSKSPSRIEFAFTSYTNCSNLFRGFLSLQVNARASNQPSNSPRRLPSKMTSPYMNHHLISFNLCSVKIN